EQVSKDGDKKVENEIGEMRTGAVARDSYPSLQQTAQAQLAAKTLQQYHSPEVGQMGLAEGQMQCSQGFGHGARTAARGFPVCTQKSLTVNFVSRCFYSPRTARILDFVTITA